VKIVVDTYAWIEIFIGGNKGKRAKENLENATEVCTPDTVLAEIARKYLREKINQEVITDRLKIITEASDITSINIETAVEAAKCYIHLSQEAKKAEIKAPSLFDAIVLATAKLLNAKVLTGDEHLKNQPETLWIG